MSRAIHKMRGSGIIFAVDGALQDDQNVLTTYTFAASWAAPAGIRRVVVATILGENTGDSDRVINSVTIDGISATILEQTTTTSNSAPSCLAAAFVPPGSGESGDVVVVFNGPMARASCQITTLFNVQSLSPTFNGGAFANNGASVNVASVTVQGGGIVLGAATHSIQAESSTWTNLTEKSDANVTMRASHAFDLAKDFNSGDTVTFAVDTGTARMSMSLASLR